MAIFISVLLSVAFLHWEHYHYCSFLRNIIHLAISCWRVCDAETRTWQRSKGLLVTEINHHAATDFAFSISVKMVLMSANGRRATFGTLYLRRQTGRLQLNPGACRPRTDHFNTIQHKTWDIQAHRLGGRPTATTRPPARTASTAE